MDTKLNRPLRAELARSLRRRYQAATGRAKKQILAEFIATTGYHPKYAIHVLHAAEPTVSGSRGRVRPSLYDEAAKQALIVLWEASDRVCGKRLKPLLKILLPALERHGHLRLEEGLRTKLLAMSAATIDRLLRAPRRAAHGKPRRRAVPAIRRRVPVRTFADWHDPPPGCMEMDLVAHCGDSTRGSYIHSLVLTDIASGWTESAPLVVRERTLLVETLDRIRVGLPFPLRALDVDNGSEFLNETMLEYCLRHGIELTRSRPYRKNDQAWIEQKNGAVVRKLLGYRRFEGIAAAQVFARLYGTSRLFVNFFQPSFKLAEKHREGAHVTKRYFPPETPCERLLQAPTIPEPVKGKLRDVAASLDPLQLLEEIRALQSYLVALSEGGLPNAGTPSSGNLTEFLSSLPGAWRAGEIRPTHAVEPNPRYLRQIRTIVRHGGGADARLSDQASTPTSASATVPASPASVDNRPQMPPLDPEMEARCERQRAEFARRKIRRQHAFELVWPLICRRLEGRPNMNATELFDELRAQYPGRWHRGQLRAFAQRVGQWREDARARGIEIGSLRYRPSSKPRTRRRPDPLAANWSEMLQQLELDPDQTARELLAQFQARYPNRYCLGQLRTVQRRLRIWRQQAVQRLICDMEGMTEDLGNHARPARPRPQP
jgi:Integrase core domain